MPLCYPKNQRQGGVLVGGGENVARPLGESQRMSNDRQRLRAPRQDGQALVLPAGRQLPAMLKANKTARAGWNYDVQGRSLLELSDQARLELLDGALAYTRAYRDVAASNADSPIFASGHQPGMFHPGVWAKNFALGRWAALFGAAAVNLIVDNDTFKSPEIIVPTGAVDAPTQARVAFDATGPELPWEERAVLDDALAESFSTRVRQVLGSLVPNPLLNDYWPLVRKALAAGARWGTALAQARHQLEGQWGLATLEFPQSQFCQLAAIRWLTAHLLAQGPRFREVHNQAVARYRRRNRLRSANHPFPDLAQDADWIEAPFWVWSTADPRRRRLFTQPRARELLVTDRHGWQARLPLTADSDATRTVEALADWSRQGIKLRTRALTTTLFARLLHCDLFVHGLGGGKYDAATDDVILNFFGVPAPQFAVVTATLHLPLPMSDGDAKTDFDASLLAINARLRELEYHPERFLPQADYLSPREAADAQKTADIKHHLVQTEAELPVARQRCHAIRTANAELQPLLARLKDQWLVEREQIVAAGKVAAVRRDREYPFCLFPAEKLWNFLLEFGLDSG